MKSIRVVAGMQIIAKKALMLAVVKALLHISSGSAGHPERLRSTIVTRKSGLRKMMGGNDTYSERRFVTDSAPSA
jgi:hypothetical protein